MNEGTGTIWFEVDDSTEVRDERGVAIGRLRPGKRYRALAVVDDHVRVPGPNGTVGRVALGDVRLDDASVAATEEDTAALPGTATSGGADTASMPPASAPPPPSPPPPPDVPAGWLPDPEHPEVFIRYWDGAGWTDHRAPAPPGGAPSAPTASASAAATADGDRGPVRASATRLTAGVCLVWAAVSLYRTAGIVNGWDEENAFGWFDETSLWWLASTPWSAGIGELAERSLTMFAPNDTVWQSPYWMLTFVVGLVALRAASVPTRRVRRWLTALLVVHVIATSALAYSPDFAGESVRIAIAAAVVPVGLVVALSVARRPTAARGDAVGAAAQRDQTTVEPTGG